MEDFGCDCAVNADLRCGGTYGLPEALPDIQCEQRRQRVRPNGGHVVGSMGKYVPFYYVSNKCSVFAFNVWRVSILSAKFTYENQLDNQKHRSLYLPLINDPDNVVEVRCAGTRSLTP